MTRRFLRCGPACAWMSDRSAPLRSIHLPGPHLGPSIAFPVETEEAMPAKRELIDTGTDKRYVRRSTNGRFKESDDVGRSLLAGRRRKAKTVAKRGQGDKGDRRR
jgi:hypothetical protein